MAYVAESSGMQVMPKLSKAVPKVRWPFDPAKVVVKFWS
jgi:hypothetical protein